MRDFPPPVARYDFRPAYLALRDVAEQVRPCAVLALTATATPAVREDIARRLGLRDRFVFVAPFDRPNLRLEVIPCESGEIARSSDRIATMSVGVEDYCLGLGVEPSPEGLELLYPVARLVMICRAVGVQPTGLVGSIAGFRDLATFEGAAVRARQLGGEGAGCIHPDQDTVLNRVFTPDPAKVERRKAEALGRGSTPT